MKKIITETIVNELFKKGVKVIPVKKNDIITPLAKDRITELKMQIAYADEITKNSSAGIFANDIKLTNKIIIGYDSFSSSLLQNIVPLIKKIGYEADLLECLQNGYEYAILTQTLVSKIINEKYKFGILLLEDGMGANIIANRNKGIRAVNVIDNYLAKLAREKYNSNILIINTGFVGSKVSEEIVKSYLTTNFGGGDNKISLKDDL
ncbi:MAG TPA: RpiB/LacA/LacB family sugar-phosphate isomerase [Ignavibacteriales bacterium]|nr:RpiB/LacA/LacB family sugar-phosphate isomerase [Ignavibacteriales bacterium]HOL80562.1 RpiB/LacA/LacB family sugar-phosphate isomerase [Ignavibacteriales bacterium]HOM64252.1 RpiB/LacA/LacB family sugar-phosphate isomerase [Ignavibacteriales bacterium]HPD67274.1 RpiB/LacA/LacB family sugar-phosphate isomerase [Ignavibacteriales bacterium]HPP33102.1 RpiB/LacA/LacB family sugar-phosphate isomerase [Ignavibacteriales bacterium]